MSTLSNIQAYVVAAMQLSTVLIEAGEDLIPLVNKTISVVKGKKDPSDDDWKFIHDAQDRLQAIINTPVPDDE